jgi:hypothetical protein
MFGFIPQPTLVLSSTALLCENLPDTTVLVFPDCFVFVYRDMLVASKSSEARADLYSRICHCRQNFHDMTRIVPCILGSTYTLMFVAVSMQVASGGVSENPVGGNIQV